MLFIPAIYVTGDSEEHVVLPASRPEVPLRIRDRRGPHHGKGSLSCRPHIGHYSTWGPTVQQTQWGMYCISLYITWFMNCTSLGRTTGLWPTHRTRSYWATYSPTNSARYGIVYQCIFIYNVIHEVPIMGNDRYLVAHTLDTILLGNRQSNKLSEVWYCITVSLYLMWFMKFVSWGRTAICRPTHRTRSYWATYSPTNSVRYGSYQCVISYNVINKVHIMGKDRYLVAHTWDPILLGDLQSNKLSEIWLCICMSLKPDIRKRVFAVQPHLYGLRLINNGAI